MVGYLICFIGMVSRAILVDGEPDGIFAAWLLAAMLLIQAALVLSIVYVVFYSISLYQVYKSCNPDTAVVFLVLSILISGIQAFFLLADRNLDRGMPPRRQQVQPLPETPAAQAPVDPEDSDGTSM